MRCHYCGKIMWLGVFGDSVPIGKTGKKWAHHICWVKKMSNLPLETGSYCEKSPDGKHWWRIRAEDDNCIYCNINYRDLL